MGQFDYFKNLEQALQWAKHLDSDNFVHAFNLISKDCIYFSPDGEIIGPEKIISSYKEHSQRAQKLFDSVI